VSVGSITLIGGTASVPSSEFKLDKTKLVPPLRFSALAYSFA